MHLSSGELWHSSGELRRSCAELRGAGFWVAMGSYGHVKSSYTFWWHLGPFPSSGELSPELAGAGGNRIPTQVNRITAQVFVGIMTGSFD